MFSTDVCSYFCFSVALSHPTPQQLYSLSFSDTKMTVILDQKHYIEELNRHLSGTVTDLQAKMDSIEKTNSKLVEEVRLAVCELLCDCVCACTWGGCDTVWFCSNDLSKQKAFLSNVNIASLYVKGVLYLTDERVFSFPQLTAATDRINSLREEQEQLRRQNETILQSSQKKEEVRKHLQVTATIPVLI